MFFHREQVAGLVTDLLVMLMTRMVSLVMETVWPNFVPVVCLVEVQTVRTTSFVLVWCRVFYLEPMPLAQMTFPESLVPQVPGRTAFLAALVRCHEMSFALASLVHTASPVVEVPDRTTFLAAMAAHMTFPAAQIGHTTLPVAIDRWVVLAAHMVSLVALAVSPLAHKTFLVPQNMTYQAHAGSTEALVPQVRRALPESSALAHTTSLKQHRAHILAESPCLVVAKPALWVWKLGYQHH